MSNPTIINGWIRNHALRPAKTTDEYTSLTSLGTDGAVSINMHIGWDTEVDTTAHPDTGCVTISLKGYRATGAPTSVNTYWHVEEIEQLIALRDACNAQLRKLRRMAAAEEA